MLAGSPSVKMKQPPPSMGCPALAHSPASCKRSCRLLMSRKLFLTPFTTGRDSRPRAAALFQKLAHSCDQGRRGVRLGKKVGLLPVKFRVEFRTRVTGRKNQFERWRLAPKRMSQRYSILIWKNRIAQQKVNLLRIKGEQFLGGGGILCPQDTIARLPEDVAGDFANERFIFDYEHGFCRMQPCLNARHQFWNRYRSHKASKSTESHCIAHSILRGRHV